MKSKYQIALPYPKVEVTEPNLEYVKILLEDYAGRASELTAINQYSYHHFITDERYKEIAEDLIGIAIAEMKHLELLAEVIIKLGGNPIYMECSNNQQRYWDSTNVNYSTSIPQLLLANIELEKKAIRGYQEHIKLIANESIQNLLRRIIMDEELHLEIFTNLYNKYG